MGLWDMMHTVESLHVKSSMPKTHNIIGLKLAIVAMGAKKIQDTEMPVGTKNGEGKRKEALSSFVP